MRYHFIAIGGSVMHNLALALAKDGHTITGSDDEIHEPSKSRLEAAGLLPESLGWYPERILKKLDGVVLGMHARADNPELLAAQSTGLPIYSFPEFVYERSRNKQRVVIAGSHGKTTTTAMILHVLCGLGKDTDYLVGAKLAGFELNVRLTEAAPVVVLEGDEYHTSPLDARPKFLHYHPQILVITGIAWDHVNVFPTYESYLKAFKDLLEEMQEGSSMIYYQADKELEKLVGEHLRPGVQKVGYDTPGYTLSGNTLTVTLDGQTSPVAVYGAHNLSNMQAAHRVCQALGISTTDFLAQIATFTGADRRLETIHQDDRVTIIRDFAHAPSKVKATLQAVLERYAGKNIIPVLELHTYSSLDPAFLPQFAGTLASAIRPIVLVDQHTLELKRRAPISDDQLLAAFKSNDLVCVRTHTELVARIKERMLNEGNIILLMSSGSLTGLTNADILG